MANHFPDDEIKTLESLEIWSWQQNKKWIIDGIKESGQVFVASEVDTQFWTLKKEADSLWSISVVIDAKRLYVSYEQESCEVTLEEEKAKERYFIIGFSRGERVYFRTPGNSRYLQEKDGFLQLFVLAPDEIIVGELEWYLTLEPDTPGAGVQDAIVEVRKMGSTKCCGNQDVSDGDPIPVENYHNQKQLWCRNSSNGKVSFSVYPIRENGTSFVSSKDNGGNDRVIRLFVKGTVGAVVEFEVVFYNNGSMLRIQSSSNYVCVDDYDELAVGSMLEAQQEGVWSFILNKINSKSFPFPRRDVPEMRNKEIC